LVRSRAHARIHRIALARAFTFGGVCIANTTGGACTVLAISATTLDMSLRISSTLRLSGRGPPDELLLREARTHLRHRHPCPLIFVITVFRTRVLRAAARARFFSDFVSHDVKVVFDDRCGFPGLEPHLSPISCMYRNRHALSGMDRLMVCVFVMSTVM